jgi:hypothetical protein
MRLVKTDEAIRLINLAYKMEQPDTPTKVENFITKEIPSILEHLSFEEPIKTVDDEINF